MQPRLKRLAGLRVDLVDRASCCSHASAIAFNVPKALVSLTLLGCPRGEDACSPCCSGKAAG
jgi:hypothetical protein